MGHPFQDGILKERVVCQTGSGMTMDAVGMGIKVKQWDFCPNRTVR